MTGTRRDLPRCRWGGGSRPSPDVMSTGGRDAVVCRPGHVTRGSGSADLAAFACA